MAMSQREYDDLVRRETQRYGRGPVTGRGGTESARDAAVRAANLEAGFGNSTAYRKLQQNAVGGGVKPEQVERKAKGSAKPDRTARTASTRGPYADMRTPTSAPGSTWPGSTATSPSSLGTFLPNMTTPTSAPGSNYPQPNPVPMNPAMSMASILRPTPPDLLANVMSTPTSAPGSNYPQYGAGGLPDISLARSMPYQQRRPEPVPGVGMPDTGVAGRPVVGSGNPLINPFRWF